jgi:hypothetical protein
MQLCEYTTDRPSLPLPNLNVNTDVYYLCFPRDYWWIKFSGTSRPLSHAMAMLSSGSIWPLFARARTDRVRRTNGMG